MACSQQNSQIHIFEVIFYRIMCNKISNCAWLLNLKQLKNATEYVAAEL